MPTSDSADPGTCGGPTIPSPRYTWPPRAPARSEGEPVPSGSHVELPAAAKTMLLLSDSRASSPLPPALATHDRHIALTAPFTDTPARVLADAAAALRVDAMIVDAREDTNLARMMCQQLAATAASAARNASASTDAVWPGRSAILAMIDEDGLSRFTADWGADDFVLSTASAAELDMRVRRATTGAVPRTGPRPPPPHMLVVGPLVIDPTGYTAVLTGQTLSLPRREFELLTYLARHPGQVFTRETLLSEVWQYAPGGTTRTVDVHIRSLRAKLGPHHHMIRTVRNSGYQILDVDQGDPQIPGPKPS